MEIRNTLRIDQVGIASYKEILWSKDWLLNYEVMLYYYIIEHNKKIKWIKTNI